MTVLCNQGMTEKENCLRSCCLADFVKKAFTLYTLRTQRERERERDKERDRVNVLKVQTPKFLT